MSHCRTLLSTTLVSLFLGLTGLPHLYAQSASPLLFPPWAETTIACPVDMHERSEPPVFDAEYGGVPVGQGASFGPSDGIEVLAATGTENYIPAPDLDIYNPTGARVHFQRCFRSDQALAGYGSPGLAPGWVHNFDLRIVAVDPAKLGGPLQLVYPSGAREPLIPILDATGKPTGTMKAPSGVRSIVTGTPGMAAGVWQQITMTWDGNVTWVFTPSPKGGGTYLLSQMSGLTVTDDDHQRLVAITDTASKKVLMRCVYAASGYLSYINDFSGRKINFAFGTPRGTNLTGTTLLAVSQITEMTAKTVPAARFYYGYTSLPYRFYRSPALPAYWRPWDGYLDVSLVI